MGFDIESLAYNDQGLIPAIAQDAGTGEILMMAWMSRDSIAASHVGACAATC